MRHSQLVLVGALTDFSGMADEARGFLRAMHRTGRPAAAKNMHWADRGPELGADDEAILDAAINRPCDNMPLTLMHLYVPHRAQRQANADAHPNAHRAMWEADRIPGEFARWLMSRDEVWVPCQHNVRTFEAGGVPSDRLQVLGETIDFEAFTPDADPIELPGDPGRFAFLTNFDFSERKGWRDLLDAWALAFGPDDPVKLVLKVFSFTLTEQQMRERVEDHLRRVHGQTGKTAPVHLLCADLAARDMPSLYTAAGCYVSPSRGEAWGRPLMEAMACGLPTAGPDYGGNLDFMDGHDCWLIDGELVDIADEHAPTALYRGQRWFRCDPEALAQIMRDVASDPAAAADRARPARQRLIDAFGDEAIARRLQKLCDRLRARWEDRRSRPVAFALRGPHGRYQSLALVNDNIALAVERDHRAAVTRIAVDEEAPPVDAVGVTHSWPADFSAPTTGPTVAVLPWEFGAAPTSWVRGVRERVDRVWVPSRHVAHALADSGVPPAIVDVVPNGYDPEIFTPDGPALALGTRAQQARTVFLFVGGTIWRKGIDVLLDAWQEAFGPGDGAALVVKDHGSDTTYQGMNVRGLVAQLAARDDIAPVELVDANLAPERMGDLYRAADVLVHPYRGEGFALPVLEAMACGVPVIHTAAGPTGEFCHDGGWPLPSRRVPLPDGASLPMPVSGEPWVLEPDRDALIDALRDAHRPDRRAPRSQAALREASAMTWSDAAGVALAAARALTGTRTARTVVRARIAALAHIVLLAPDDWEAARWQPALDAWIAAGPAGRPVTLALYTGHTDTARVVELVEAHIAGRDCGDVTVCAPGPDAGLPEVVCASDALLLADGQQPTGDLQRAPYPTLPEPDSVSGLLELITQTSRP